MLGGVEIRFEGIVTGKVEIREPGQEWESIEKVEGTVCQPKAHHGPRRPPVSLADFQALDL